jgi:hypothetical protein
MYHLVEAAQKLSIVEKIYPVAYIRTDDITSSARNLWSIIRFIIGNIDPDLVSDENNEQ